MLLPSAAEAPRLRVLSVVSSSNQLYSGIGRSIFALARWQNRRVEFSFAIDDANPRNCDLLLAFGQEIGASVHVGRGFKDRLGLDSGNADLPELLARDDWDVVEAACFANTTTNAALLTHIRDRPLTYTPHDQPLWTIPLTSEQSSHVETVHHQMLRRADAVACVSPFERQALQRLIPERSCVFYVPNGCDFASFGPGPDHRRPELLFVGDLAEPRKRFDRVLEVLALVRRRRPELRLVVVGNRSQAIGRQIARTLRPAVVLRGFVSENELRQAYTESAGVLLLSDYEAFGIPILEALVSRTPAFIADFEPVRSLFAPYAGAIECPAADPAATADRILDALGRWSELRDAMTRDHERLRASFHWGVIAARKWQILAAAWHRRRGFALAI